MRHGHEELAGEQVFVGEQILGRVQDADRQAGGLTFLATSGRISWIRKKLIFDQFLDLIEMILAVLEVGERRLDPSWAAMPAASIHWTKLSQAFWSAMISV